MAETGKPNDILRLRKVARFPIAEARMCICGHERRWHEFCSDEYPALCTYEVSPGEDYPLCHCLDFEGDE